MTSRGTLKDYVKRYLSISETEAMNRLQDRGIISDNVIDIENVAKADQIRAIQWLSYPQQPHQA